MAHLEFTVGQVHGTAAIVAVGERYVVRGQYTLAGGAPFALSLAVFTKAFGATAYLLPGEGRFEISTEILDLADTSTNGLGIVVANEQTGKGDIVRWVMLAG